MSYLVVDVLGFQINPPRNNGSIAYFGAAHRATGLARPQRQADRPPGRRPRLRRLRARAWPSAGCWATLANVLTAEYGFTINHWNVMEVSCGFIGGFLYCFGMVDREYPEPPEGENIPLASAYGILFVLGILPLWHRLARIRPEAKLKEWAASLESYGYADPEGLARTVLRLIDGVCVLGFVGAAIWLVIHFRRRQRLAVLPVLWLSATMLLFQNLNALYFFYPRVPRQINMHNVFWVMFALMALYAAVARPRPVAEPAGTDAEAEPTRFPLAGLDRGDDRRPRAGDPPRRFHQRREDDGVGQHALAHLAMEGRPVPGPGGQAVIGRGMSLRDT